MKIKPTSKGLQNMIELKKKQAEEAEKAYKKPNSKLPPAGYHPEFEPSKFIIRESEIKSNPDHMLLQYLEKKVMRIDDDEGIPYVWLTMYQQRGEEDTGTYLKGKQIYFPLERIFEVIDELTDLADECEKRKLI